MKLPKKRILEFHSFIFNWWKNHRRDLPWRRTHDPYKILIAEVMLQQTQVSRVLPKYKEFLEAFPTVHHLAESSAAHIIRIWKGMGYNRRALYLKQTAENVVEKYSGIFPREENLLMKLPGLGKYTTRAIQVFAYKMDTYMVDTNIRQIITHFFFDGTFQKEKIIEEIAAQLVPIGKSWDWHQALMDYGAIALKRIRPERLSRVKSRESRRTQPFRESNRFFRGRIIDRLREGELKEFVLIDDLSKQYEKEPEFFYEMINGLIKDGLLVRSHKEIVSLPF